MNLNCCNTDSFKAGPALFFGCMNNVLHPVTAVLAHFAFTHRQSTCFLCSKMAATSQESTWLPALCIQRRQLPHSQESTWLPAFCIQRWQLPHNRAPGCLLFAFQDGLCVRLDWRQTDIMVTVSGLEHPRLQLKLELKIHSLKCWGAASLLQISVPFATQETNCQPSHPV